MGVEIRRAEPGEGEEIGRLTEQSYRDDRFIDDDYTPELLDGEARIRDAVVFVAIVDDGLAGSVTVATTGTPFAEISRDGEIEVRMLAVASHARRLGLADRLMDEVEAHGQRIGMAGVVLSTADSMRGAHRLYERRGYRRLPDRDWVVGDLPLMVYGLPLG